MFTFCCHRRKSTSHTHDECSHAVTKRGKVLKSMETICSIITLTMFRCRDVVSTISYVTTNFLKRSYIVSSRLGGMSIAGSTFPARRSGTLSRSFYVGCPVHLPRYRWREWPNYSSSLSRAPRPLLLRPRFPTIRHHSLLSSLRDASLPNSPSFCERSQLPQLPNCAACCSFCPCLRANCTDMCQDEPVHSRNWWLRFQCQAFRRPEHPFAAHYTVLGQHGTAAGIQRAGTSCVQ